MIDSSTLEKEGKAEVGRLLAKPFSSPALKIGVT